MGKKQHQKDKLYVTSREWKESFGGHKDNKDTRVQRAKFKRLPFTHCALSFLPFKKPVCTAEGIIFDKEPLLAYITRNGINPVNGEKLPVSQLVDLKFSVDSDGNFQCPVTFRTFTPSSLIVAIRTTGNVYSMDAVKELNLKRNHLKDLLNDVPFKRSDIITLQDPNDVEKFNMEKFYHFRFNTGTQEQIAEVEEEIAKKRDELSGKVALKISAPQLKSDSSSKFPKPNVHGSDVGKYIKPDLRVAIKRVTEQESTDEELQKKIAPRPFSDFSEW